MEQKQSEEKKKIAKLNVDLQKLLTRMLSQLFKHSLAHMYNYVMQMWEVFL